MSPAVLLSGYWVYYLKALCDFWVRRVSRDSRCTLAWLEQLKLMARMRQAPVILMISRAIFATERLQDLTRVVMIMSCDRN